MKKFNFDLVRTSMALVSFLMLTACSTAQVEDRFTAADLETEPRVLPNNALARAQLQNEISRIDSQMSLLEAQITGLQSRLHQYNSLPPSVDASAPKQMVQSDLGVLELRKAELQKEKDRFHSQLLLQ